MTDTTDSTPPFPGFPGFPPAEMLDQLWGMMRLSPFGSALTGAQPGGGLGPSLSMMSDMMAPLTNIEELDKRITDMRAVEQWLKLNLSMLQSAIQALEVQRATLSALRAFGAFAQSSMAQPAAASAAPSPAPARGWPHPAAPAAPSAASPQSAAPQADNEASAENGEEETPATPAFDASAWWNLLQSQFNQIAQFAVTQPAVAVAAAGGRAATDAAQDAESAPAAGSPAAGASPASTDDTKAATKRPAAKRAPAAAKRAGSTSASGSSAKKST
ncbi:transcriptional regulator [Paraburkholderia panacisoli]|uniref:Transcriptional regulator n=1 Tax=Paraburkholderia panacisoli TaxID=2603818 RepID=A0A5B0HIE3_9BURK|nr:PhaM family polyhydroxyalkanoate granule multifunctional regulatory protein [Paraburkholderia panacisoli]KAA1015045.1 transcriptional regulator [Paraburkholderia panacisoli]